MAAWLRATISYLGSRRHGLRLRLGPVWLARTQTTLALLVAAVLVWRLRGTLGLGGPAVDNFVCF